MNIYFVTVVNEEPMRTRTWGWYQKFEEAQQAVKENHTDIFECGYYSHAVIEEFPEGVCALPENATWYKANYKDFPLEKSPVVDVIERPEKFKDTAFWSIGQWLSILVKNGLAAGRGGHL